MTDLAPQSVSALNFLQSYDLAPAALGSGGTFTSPSISLGTPMGYSRWRVFAFSDQAGTLSLQQSTDDTTWYTTLSQACAAGQGMILESLVALPFVRAVYVNGSTAQTAFRLVATLVAV